MAKLFYWSSGIGIVPDVRMLSDNSQGKLLTPSAYNEWRVGLLQRLGLAMCLLELIVTSCIGGEVLSEELFDECTGFSETPDTLAGGIERIRLSLRLLLVFSSLPLLYLVDFCPVFRPHYNR